VQPDGISLELSVLSAAEIFWVMQESEPYDVAEMSLTGYLWAVGHGKRWIALPVFPAWVYGCHTETLVNKESGIERPEDLRGKRVGVPEYAVTAIGWIRDAWERDAGLRREDIIWCEERTAAASHYRPWGYQPPGHIPVESIPTDRCLSEMLISGEIDAVTRYFGAHPPLTKAPLADRSSLTLTDLSVHPNVRWLYSDRVAAAHEYQHRIGSPQPIHCVVIKCDVLERHPWVARSLYAAFVKTMLRTRDAETIGPVRTSFPFPASEQQRIFGDGFLPCGLAGMNRTMVARLIELAAKDGLVIGDLPAVEDLFHEDLRD
jgi:4,5-dihydroxyphthalate decarboxylase